MMHVVYALETPPETFARSIFLAGPSPRRAEHPDWRVEALKMLGDSGYDGVVFVPLPRDGKWPQNYDDQVDWETTYLHMADQIVFWIPRDLTVCEDVAKGSSAEKAMNLPAFTTNMEFGLWVGSGKCVLGSPEGTVKNRYLLHHAQAECVLVAHTLANTLAVAVNRLGDGAERTGGEREVPLHIWRLPHFQSWYQAQKAAGNRLDGAKVLWSFRVGPMKVFTFAYALHVNVHIAAEGRNKTNEFIIGRPDIATIVAYRTPPGLSLVDVLMDTEIALIREFRSPARTSDGFIREVPGGSSWKPNEEPFQVMASELEEETGLVLNVPERIRRVGARQVCGTLSTHQAHVFAVEVTEDEMAFFKQQAADNVVHGVEADTERTYVEVHRLGDLLAPESNLVDWSMLGMILTAVSE